MILRKSPARESAFSPKFTKYIFLTCCTQERSSLLDNKRAQITLVTLWSDRSHWSVTRYMIMPDHVHLMVFASQTATINLRGWTAWWKSHATKELGFGKGGLWLRDLWDTRMRSEEHHARKLQYMQDNPVRAGLVASADQWPYQGNL
jgi:putative transposase